MKKIMIAVAAVLALAACTKETSNVDAPEKGALQTIQVNVASFGDQTKTAVSPTGGFTWSEGDQIGIYPVSTTLGTGQTSQQIVFKINGTGDAKSATFTGTGWGLLTDGNYKYFSYYPYSADAKYDEASVSYSDNLNQTANSSTAHLGCNDYLYAPQIQPTDVASASFTFKHLGVLVEFEVTMPNDVWSKKITRMKVTAPSPLFTVSGKYDPSSSTSTVAPAITENVYTEELNLKFSNGEGFTPDTYGKIHAYFLIAPTAVSGQKLDIKLWDEDNKAYVTSITPSSNWVSQDYKKGTCTATPKPTLTAEDLSANGTANCYIVPEAGKYKFRANVRGNGVDPILTDSEDSTINMAGCSAEVIWETVNTNVAPDAGTIVTNSTIGIEGNYIVFDATGVEGNALIALKKGGDIVWSWHIWSTSADLEALKQTYPNDAGVMMDRNLGALSAEPGNGLTLGFHYQWGRPFPITGYSSNNGAFSSTRMATTNSSVWVEEETTSAKGTLAYSAANPTHFIYASASNYYKGQTSGSVSGNWLWTADAETGYTSSTMPALWSSAKTMYDPSPVGWKVPKNGVWTIAGFSTSNSTSVNNGRNFNLSTIYYPYAGYRGGEANAKGTLYSVTVHGCYWSSVVSGNNVLSMYITSTTVSGTTSRVRAFGFPIRPIHE